MKYPGVLLVAGMNSPIPHVYDFGSIVLKSGTLVIGRWDEFALHELLEDVSKQSSCIVTLSPLDHQSAAANIRSFSRVVRPFLRTHPVDMITC